MDIPPVASRDEWLAARKDLLAQLKQASHAKDVLDAARLPMIEIDKEYSFAGPEGPAGLCGPGRCANRRAQPATMSAGMAAMLLAML